MVKRIVGYREDGSIVFERDARAYDNSMEILAQDVKEIKIVLFGDKGEKGVVSKLSDMIDVAKKIEGILWWISRLVFGALVLAALPSLTSFLNMVTHLK